MSDLQMACEGFEWPADSSEQRIQKKLSDFLTWMFEAEVKDHTVVLWPGFQALKEEENQAWVLGELQKRIQSCEKALYPRGPSFGRLQESIAYIDRLFRELLNQEPFLSLDVAKELIPLMLQQDLRFVSALLSSSLFRKHIEAGLLEHLEHVAEKMRGIRLCRRPHEKTHFLYIANKFVHFTEGEVGAAIYYPDDAELLVLNFMKPRLQRIVFEGEVWSDRFLEHYQEMDETRQLWWNHVLEWASSAKSSTPSASWRKKVTMSLFSKEEQRRQFLTLMNDVLPLVDRGKSPPFEPDHRLLLFPQHAQVLKGFVWMLSDVNDSDTASLLGALAQSAYKKVPQVGPRAVSVGNACVFSLGEMNTEASLGQLALLKVKVKFGGAQNAMDKALQKTAERLGVSREDLEEMSVPSYGMTSLGELREGLGTGHLVLALDAKAKAFLHWETAEGKLQKTLPAAVKTEFADEVKQILAAKKDIERIMPVLAERLDQQFLRRHPWSFDTWKERYHDHPLVGVLSQKLIWRFHNSDEWQSVFFSHGEWRKLGGEAVEPTSTTQVSLWHPLHTDAAEVQAWRAFLEEHQIVQPLKQAFREIYVLTPAEEQTRVYSNRYAAHLLKQHQFHALCAARGWKNRLRLGVDDEYPPATKWLKDWGLRAEYWIEGICENYEFDLLDSGAYKFITTDQVRFHRLDDAQATAHAGGGGYGFHHHALHTEAVPLAEIPGIVFSEIMRDADLFVGVSSVGNDPNWLEQGVAGGRADYWHHYGFGELSGTATSRKELLETLIPRLKIAEKCQLKGRFLEVQGARHLYKIHLGSGNILIAPEDRYLCIVPKREIGNTQSIYLPFEGDRTLSLILSKAFLLADDQKISDPTILAQLY